MTRIFLIACVALTSLPQIAAAQTPAPAAATAASAPDGQLRTFLTELQAGRTAQAVDGLLAASTRAGQKPGERENLLAQVEATVQTYGPVVTFEKSSAQQVGTMIIRQYYLVQHRDMVVRWEFYLVRTGTGWRVDYFAFDDQPRTWF